ncbi:MAG TPA: hypothetical protein VF046_01765 [Gemmatimonadales bacterium]
MPRSNLTALLLLALAGPGAAQTAGTTAWTVAVGDYLLFGHTDYVSTFKLIPRIVYDTAPALDSSRVVDSVRTAGAESHGLAAGLSAWPADFYCDGVTTGALQQIDPRAVLERVQLAARCGVRLVLTPPRRNLTADGRPNGSFSVDSAKRVTDRFAAALPPDTLRKYRSTLLGLNLADDYTCTECWGGKPITQVQIAAWAAYARTKLPDLPLGVRVTPDWVQAYPGLAPLLDYTWAQYHTKKGDAQAYYDQAAEVAGALGLRVVMGVNVENCYGVGTACSAADLRRFGMLAVSHPAACAFLSWRYDAGTWASDEIRGTWDELFAIARARPAQDCRRVEV